MAQALTDKQKQVLAKITELTEKNGRTPTLEDLRVALTYPRISSVQRHTDALKEKGYLDQSIRGLSIFRVKNIDSIFTLRNEQLGLLASQPAVVFFRSLLWAEARRIGIPLSKINISLWTTVPDGGIDASVTDSGIEIAQTSGLIKEGATGYQIKTGSSFQPWQDSEIKKELFGRKSPAKENLGSSVKTCLDQDGTFVLVCFGQEFTDDQLRQAKEALISYFKQCGYQNPKIDVWGQSNIIGFTQLFPSLVLQLQGFDRSQFQTHESWGRQDDMQKEFKAGKVQNDLITSLQTALRRNEQAIHARICAEPGNGKTRLVLEATTVEDLKPLVIYCDSPDKFRDSNLMNEILKEDNGFSVLLIIDECNSDSQSYIWNKLKNLGSRIKMITIYNEHESRSGTTAYFDAPILEKDQISAIIQEYSVQKDQADRWSELCSGSPRVAHVIGWNLKNNPDDVLKPLDTVNIWDRYIVGGDNPQDAEVKQRKTVLQYVALFRMFGFGRAVINEAQAVSKMIAEADPQITFPRFQQIVKKLRERKILQGETTIYITPKALHIYLWKEWWNTFGDGFDFEEFSAKIPDSLREWFYEMFVYAAESEAASTIVKELLGDSGPFQKDDYLKSRLGSEFFLALTEANSEAALKCLQKTVGTWGKDELLRLKEPRRNFVRALERIAVWKDLFPEAARLLLLLAEAENENYSNNSSGTFTGLFSPGPGGVAPTEASPKERFPILQEALNSDSKEKRILAIAACDKGLEANHFARVVGPEYQGLRSAQLWRPKDRKEMMDAYSRVWTLLYSKVDSLSGDEQKKAIEVLSNNARSLTPAPELAKIIIPNLTELSGKHYVDKREILETVESILHYGKKELSPEIMKRWEKLRDDLVGKDFPSLMRRYVAMDLLEDKFGEDNERVDKAEKPIQELVQQAISDHELLKPELTWLVTPEAKSGYRFAYELGKQDKYFSLLPLLLEAQRAVANDENTSDYFLGGYLKALFEKDPKQWESLMDELAEDKILASWVSGLTWRSGVTDQGAARILDLAKKGVLKAYHFRVFGLGSVISNLGEDVFTRWIQFLLDCAESYAASIALDLYHFFYIRKDSKYVLPKELTLRLLTHNSLFKQPEEGRRDQMDDFHWQEIANKFIELYPENSLNLIDVALEHFGEDGTVLEGYRSHAISVINAISQKYPGEVWQRVKKYLGPPIDSRAYHIKEWLRGEGFFEEKEGTLATFTPNMVWEWVDEDKEKRAWYLASFVPKVLFRQEGRTCWARELLVRYGEREDVQNNLMANFSSEGWSGPASEHYQQKKEGLLAFKEKEDNENVNRWIDRFVIGLDKQIAHEKIREERDGF